VININIDSGGSNATNFHATTNSVSVPSYAHFPQNYVAGLNQM